MVSWSKFSAVAPEVASSVSALLYQYGPGLAYLATVRPDGGPRVHPVSPVIADGGLLCFILDSPKRRDLLRDGRYALHAYPAETSDDEAYLSGRASRVTDRLRVARLAEAVRAEPRVDWALFELSVEVAMVVRRPDSPCGSVPGGPSAGARPPAQRTVWRERTRSLECAS
jgi:hypothetical protein